MARRSWKNRDWVSTLEAAKLLGLCHMTVIRRFDAGELKGFRVPGSRYRRIPKQEIIAFARRNGMPVPDFSLEGSASEAPEQKLNMGLALVVEDDRSMASLMEKVLKHEGWEVRIARNGFDAGFLAGSLQPRLVLLDIMLPGVDGREACRQMRADPRLAGTRILAVTALRNEKSRREIFEAGIDAYLPKPFDLKDLRAEIQRLTGGPEGSLDGSQIIKESTKLAD